MRVGMNPQKQERKIDLKTHHRVIIVVFIPQIKGYYSSIFDVLKLCLESVNETKNEFCEITVVNNGSCKIVTDFLNKMYHEGRVNCVISHKYNIGKIDALIGAARTAREQFITLADVDILFVRGWQENVEKIFQSFNDAGSVSPLPVRESEYYATFSALKKIIMRKVNFRYQPIPENFNSYNKFLESVNWEPETDMNLRWPVIKSKGVKAILGSGHQVITISREVLFSHVPFEPSLILVGNDSEYNYIDLPIDLSGKMRLSTYNNFAFHMGNKVEDWMLDVQIGNIEKKTKNASVNISNSKIFINSGSKKSIFRILCYKLKKKVTRYLFKKKYKR